MQVAILASMKALEVVFGEIIRKHREKQEISQEKFAEIAGVHRTYISSIELGKVQISIVVAQKLADALNVPLSKIWKEIERATN